MSNSVETFRITAEQAELYEAAFVPNLFAEWAAYLVDAVGVEPGQTVIDVACGTGVVARACSDRTGTDGRVVGLDINEAMLGVARRLRPDIEWRQGDAADLPFPAASFDVVVCQAALMFFPDRTEALREMARVVSPNGTVGVQVFSSLEAQPAYGPFVEVAARHAGPEAINLLSTYWSCGDLDLLASQFEAAGLEVTDSRTRMGTANADTIEQVVRTEVESTPLIERISDEVYGRILEDAEAVFAPFLTGDGKLEAPIEGHLIRARRR